MKIYLVVKDWQATHNGGHVMEVDVKYILRYSPYRVTSEIIKRVMDQILEGFELEIDDDEPTA